MICYKYFALISRQEQGHIEGGGALDLDQARSLGVCACRLLRDPLYLALIPLSRTLEKLRHVAELGFAEQNPFTAPQPGIKCEPG